MMLLGKGAEADVHLEEGTVKKKRIRKDYRHPELDRKIRRERNKKEARIMGKAARELRVPKVLGVGESEIEIEFIEGKRLRDLKELPEEKMGQLVGALHAAGISHGDLTTSNMILKGGELVLIDFGLADRGRVEDFATDLKVLFEAAEATHEFSRDEFLKGYRRKMPKSREILERLEKVYSRGRYISKSRGQARGKRAGRPS